MRTDLQKQLVRSSTRAGTPPAVRDDDALFNALRRNPWFGALPPLLAARVLGLCALLQVRPGETVLRQGGVPEGFFVLASGSLKASTLREDGREAILALVEPGNWFGEISLLDQGMRSHDVTALEPCELWVLAAADFEALMREADFSRAISLLLAGRIRLLYDLVEDATLRSARARVARRLLLLARGDATRAVDARRDVPVSQESLAMMLGMTRQTLSKELKALTALGAIEVRYRRIVILSAARLRSVGEAPEG